MKKLLSLFLIIIATLCLSIALPACKKEEEENPLSYGFVSEENYEVNQTPQSALTNDVTLYVGEASYFFVDYKMPIGEDSETYTIKVTVSPVQTVRARIEYAGTTSQSETTVEDKSIMSANFTPYDKEREIRVIVMLTPTKEGDIVFEGEVLHNGEPTENNFNITKTVTASASVVSGLNYTLNEDNQSYSVAGIGQETGNCIYIPSIYEGLPVTGIAASAFKESSVLEINIPNTIISIGNNAFYNCKKLASITIPDSVTSIGYSAFEDCDALKSITIPESVMSIDANAFRSCSSLVYNEYDNAKYLGNSTNRYVVLVKAKDTSITSCTINANTKYICDSAFDKCNSFRDVYISNIASWCESSGLKNFMAGKALYFNNQLITDLVIPEGVSVINSYAFYGCDSLSSVIFEENSQLTKIDARAFQGCKSLISVNIPNGVKSIGEGAFDWCLSLKSVTIPDSVTSIGKSAFNNCTLLTSIIIPDGVTSIDSATFYNCHALTSITIPDSVTSIGDRALSTCKKLESINFNGTKAQWYAIAKDSSWDGSTNNYTIHCTDGDIAKS